MVCVAKSNVELSRIGVEAESLSKYVQSFVILSFIVQLMCSLVVLFRTQKRCWHDDAPSEESSIRLLYSLDTTMFKGVTSEDTGSGDHRDFLGEALPAPAFESRVHLGNGFFKLVLLREEVRRNPDTSPSAIVDQDVPREKVLGDLVAMWNIESNCSSSLRGVARRMDLEASCVGQVDKPRREANALFP